jgi:programmed cell death 6-interacting protein
MLAVPLKATDRVKLSPLTAFLKSKGVSTGHEEQLLAFEQLRVDSTKDLRASAREALAIVYNYYQQLCYAEEIFPISDLQVSVKFTWRDAFKPEVKDSRCSIAFEKACVLFNAAALESNAAILCDRSALDGAKAALSHFQNAAGIFSHLKENIIGELKAGNVIDFSPDALDLCTNLMLGQAQAVKYERARTENKTPPSLLAKLAAQIGHFFQRALSLRSPQLKAAMDPQWEVRLVFYLTSLSCSPIPHPFSHHPMIIDHGSVN